MVTFNINNADVVKLTNILEKLNRSAMPVAVRYTLNDAAFDHREEAIKKFKSNFIIRKHNFIASHMQVNKSINTFKLSEMKAESGVIKGKSRAGDSLRLQEEGGVKYKRNIPTDATRINQAVTNLVSKRYYFQKFQNKPLGHFPSQVGIPVKRRKKLTFIKMKDRLLSVASGGKWRTLYYIDQRIKITQDAFIGPAEIRTSKKMQRLFRDRAKAQFKKLLI